MDSTRGNESAQLIELLRLLVNTTQAGQSQTAVAEEKLINMEHNKEPDNDGEHGKGQGAAPEPLHPGSDTHSSRRGTEIAEHEALQGHEIDTDDRLERQRVMGRLRQRRHQAKRREVKQEIDMKVEELRGMEKANDELRAESRCLASMLAVCEEGIRLLKDASEHVVPQRSEGQDDWEDIQDWVDTQAKKMGGGTFYYECKMLFKGPEDITRISERMDWNAYQNTLELLTTALVTELAKVGIEPEKLLHEPSLDRIFANDPQMRGGYGKILEIVRAIIVLTVLFLGSPMGSYHSVSETRVVGCYTNTMLARMCCMNKRQSNNIVGYFNNMVVQHARLFEDILVVLENLPGVVTTDVAPAAQAAQTNIDVSHARKTILNLRKRIADVSIEYIVQTAAELEPMQLAVLLAAASGRGFADVSNVARECT